MTDSKRVKYNLLAYWRGVECLGSFDEDCPDIPEPYRAEARVAYDLGKAIELEGEDE